MTEYVILLGLIGVVTIWSVGSLGLKVRDVYNTITEEVALDRETPEQVLTPGGGGGTPPGGGSTVTVPTLPDPSECVALDGYSFRASYYAGATCFYDDTAWTTSGENSVFSADFEMDVTPPVPLFIDPVPSSDVYYWFEGSSGDDIVVIQAPLGEDPFSGARHPVVITGNGGSDGIVIEGVSSTDFSWSELDMGATILRGEGNSRIIEVLGCDIAWVSFDDTALSRSDIFAAAAANPASHSTADCSNPVTPPLMAG